MLCIRGEVGSAAGRSENGWESGGAIKKTMWQDGAATLFHEDKGLCLLFRRAGENRKGGKRIRTKEVWKNCVVKG